MRERRGRRRRREGEGSHISSKPYITELIPPLARGALCAPHHTPRVHISNMVTVLRWTDSYGLQWRSKGWGGGGVMGKEDVHPHVLFSLPILNVCITTLFSLTLKINRFALKEKSLLLKCNQFHSL